MPGALVTVKGDSVVLNKGTGWIRLQVTNTLAWKQGSQMETSTNVEVVTDELLHGLAHVPLHRDESQELDFDRLKSTGFT